ncbi:serine-rich adhesin for platelets [Anabrus simplex]|uniref:serine-rich adhesin for platelets n=1 Tax=Anabrus simplex TaxID=316456 RepID=UPI0035A33746
MCDDRKPASPHDEGCTQSTPFTVIQKGLEATLMDSKKIYDAKVTALFSAWEHIMAIFTTTSQDSECTMIEWVLRHTMHIMLHGEWPKLAAATKIHLSVTLQRCVEMDSIKRSIAAKCQRLISLVNGPWDDPVLTSVGYGDGRAEFEEVLNLMRSELGTVMAVRVEILCEKRNYGVAFNLVETVVRFLDVESYQFKAQCTEDEIGFFVDVYLCLLYRKQRMQDVISYIKRWTLEDGLSIIKSYSQREENIRLWRFCPQLAVLVAQYFIAKAMMKPFPEPDSLFKEMVAEWGTLQSATSDFPETMPDVIRRLTMAAISSRHIYAICEVLVKKFGDLSRPICTELYIRFLTNDMNEWEQQKAKGDKKKIHEMEKQLSDGFLGLAETLKDHVGVSRECLLTAFSLTPTCAIYERVVEAAIASGKYKPDNNRECDMKVPSSNCAVNVDRSELVSEDKSIENTLSRCTIQVDTSQPPNMTTSSNSKLRRILTRTDPCVEQDHNEQSGSRTSFPLYRTVASSDMFQLSDSELDSRTGDESLLSGLPKVRNGYKSIDTSRPFCICAPKSSSAFRYSVTSQSFDSGPGDLCPECGGFTETESGHSDYEKEKKERTLDALISITGEGLTQSSNYDALRAPNQVLDAGSLGLTQQLCDDLAVVLSGPRFHRLSWCMEWSALRAMCEKCLYDNEGVRNATKELKYLNIDYNLFKDWKGDENKDECGGIEKGYEQDLTSDSDSEYVPSYQNYSRRSCSDTDSYDSNKHNSRRKSGRSRKVSKSLASDSESRSRGTRKICRSESSETEYRDRGKRSTRSGCSESECEEERNRKSGQYRSLASKKHDDMFRVSINEGSSLVITSYSESDVEQRENAFSRLLRKCGIPSARHFQECSQPGYNPTRNVKGHKRERTRPQNFPSESEYEDERNRRRCQMSPDSDIEVNKKRKVVRLSSPESYYSPEKSRSQELIPHGTTNQSRGNTKLDEMSSDPEYGSGKGREMSKFMLDYRINARKSQKPFHRTKATQPVSGTDTDTQDSLNDCFNDSSVCKVPNLGRRDGSRMSKTSRIRNSKSGSHFRRIASDLSGNTSDSCSEMLPIFNKTEKNTKAMNPRYAQNVNISMKDEVICSALSPDKRSSDPTVLKSLRMFRPNNSKKTGIDNMAHILKGNHSNEKVENPRQEERTSSTNFAPLLSTLNLNPRIVLTRADVNLSDTKTCKQPLSSNSIDSSGPASPDILCVTKNITSQFPISFPVASDIKRLSFDMAAQAMVDTKLLAKSVPGLNSLEMIIPQLSEPTVQVVQFPRNPSSPSSSNPNPSETSTSKVESSSNSTTNSTGCLLPGAGANRQEALQTPQSSQSRTEETSELYQSVSSQSSTTNSEDQQKQKSNSRMDVKYLTKASEVNEILRSSLRGSISQVQARSIVKSQMPSLGQSKKLVIEPEVDNITITSGVPELLRTSLMENTQVNQVGSFSQSVTDEKRKFCRNSGTTNEVNVAMSTPVTAHIQKIGQPPGESVLNATSTSSAPSHHSTQVVSCTAFTNKSVDLGILASLISSASNSNFESVERNQSANSESRIMQLFHKKVKPITSTQNSTRNSQTDKDNGSAACNETTNNDQASHSNEHISSQPLYGENVCKYSLNVAKCKLSPEEKSSRIATLPKFQQAFGKNIYNQGNSSSSTDNSVNAQSNSQETCENPSSSSVSNSSCDTVKQDDLVVTSASSSTVLSKAVQTTAVNISSQSQVETSDNISILLSPAIPGNTVVSLAQSSVARSVTNTFKRSSKLPAQEVSTVASNDLHRMSSGVENSSVSTSSMGFSLSSQSNQPAQTSQASDMSQNSQESVVGSVSLPVTGTTSQVTVTSKDSVSRSNMTALLAAALRGSSPQHHTTVSTSASLNTRSSLSDSDICIVDSSSSDEEGTDAATQTLISSVPLSQRIAVPVLQKNANRSRIKPVLHIPGGGLISRSRATAAVTTSNSVTTSIRQRQVVSSVSTSTTTNANLSSRISSQTVEASSTLINQGPMEPSVSSTTLEQLREFESVLEQVTNTSQMKERGSVQPRVQTESVNLLTRANTPSDRSSEFVTSETDTVSTFSPQFTSITATPRVGVAYVTQAPTLRTSNIVPGSTGKTSSPVVVVTTYCQPVASPALSITSQSSSSPSITPAPSSSASAGKTPPKSSKSSKSKSVKSTSSSTASKSSPVPKPQQKPQEDEQTAQRIYAILDEYAEQLRNSPDLNNKPAPRRRSNPPTNPSQSSKRKKSGQTKVKLLGHQNSSSTVEMSPGTDDPRTMGSEDSSSGIMQLSNIQDSPASSAQTADEVPSLRTTPSLDTTPEPVNSRTDTGDVQECRQQPRFILTDASGIQGRTVIVQDPAQQSCDVSVSNNAAVVAGKPLMVGSTTLPLYVPRLGFLPSLTASVQGRPVVMSKGSTKVIRVHQVAVPTSNMRSAALVVHPVCVSKPSVLGHSTVKPVKLPVGSISSQALTGVTAQPPVVLPSALTHAFSFTDSDVIQDGASRSETAEISAEEVTLNATSAGNLIHRGVQSSFRDQAPVSLATSVPVGKIAHRSSTQVSPNSLKSGNADVLNTQNVGVIADDIGCNTCSDQTLSSSNHSVLSVAHPSLSLVSGRQSDSSSSISTSQPSLTTFHLSIGFSRPSGVSLREGNSFQECMTESGAKSGMMILPTCPENESQVTEDPLHGSDICNRSESTPETASRRLDSSLSAKQSGTLGDVSEMSRPVSLEKLASAQLPDSLPHSGVQSERLAFTNNCSSPGATNEKMAHHGTSSRGLLTKDEEYGHVDSSHMETLHVASPSMQVISEKEVQHRIQPNFCPSGDNGNSSSSDKDVDLHGNSDNVHIQRSNSTNQAICHQSVTDDVNQSKSGAVFSDDPQLEFSADVGYSTSTKLSTQLNFTSDMTYQLPNKVSAESHETPWRYVTMPSIKRVHVRHPMVTRRGYTERSGEQFIDNSSEVEDVSHERRSYVSDAKLEAVERKAGVSTATVLNAFHKIDGSAQHIDKQVCERLEPIQPKITRIDKELRLQKSLSEECEDLGVDEPSTSDLFPEAELLLDTNSSPSFEQVMRDTSCSQSVESSEHYSCTNFRPLEYSSSSQEGSHQGSPPPDCKSSDCLGSHQSRKRTLQTKTLQYEWKYRAIGKDRTRRAVRTSIIHQEDDPKVCSAGQGSSTNGSSKDPSPNLIDEFSNGGSKDIFSESPSSTPFQESCLPDPNKVLTEQAQLTDSLQHENRKLCEKNLQKQFIVRSKEDSLELSQSSSSKQVLSENTPGNRKQFSSKTILSSSSRVNPFTGSSSEDIVTMLDSYASNVILSSLDVTIPSPVPTIPATITQSSESINAQDPLPSLTAAQKFSNTYRKRQITGRQDVDRVIKRARLNRPNQYFNDHVVDSQETWDSSSSQEKTCVDDDDSGSQSRTEGCSSTQDQPNSDIDVVDISNDAFPSSAASFSPVSSPKSGLSKGDIVDSSVKSFNLNGIDIKDSILLSSKCDLSEDKKFANNRRATRKSISLLTVDKCETDSGSIIDKPKRNKRTSRSSGRQMPEVKVISNSSKCVPMKQSPSFSTYSESRKLIVRARKVEECGFNVLPVPSFMKTSSPTLITSHDDGDSSVPSKSQTLDKDSTCSIDSECEIQMNTSVSRRSSLRGHIKKGCTCCSTSPQPSKKKKELLKIEKPSKKGLLKGNNIKKR